MRFTGFHRFIALCHRENARTWPICLGNQIDAHRLEALRARWARQGRPRPSYTALVVKAAASAIREVSARYPEISAAIVGLPGFRRIHCFQRLSVGVAVSHDAGGQDLVHCGVIEDPDELPLSEIHRRLQAFQAEAEGLGRADAAAQGAATHGASCNSPALRRNASLLRMPLPLQWAIMALGRSLPELRRRYRGTFTLTSVGKFGVDVQLSLPQASSLHLGFGSLRQRPVVRGGRVVPAPTFFLTLSFDRRLMNGKPCALLLERMRELLESDALDDLAAQPAAATAATAAV